jgi:hypothetical protein
MNKNIILLSVLCSIGLAAEDVKELNVAKLDYGAIATSNKLIDNSEKTELKTKDFSIILPVETKLHKIELKMKPIEGKLVFKAYKDGKTTVLAEIETDKEKDLVKFEFQEKNISTIVVEWIPADGKSQIVVQEFGAFTKNVSDINRYVNEIRPSLPAALTTNVQTSNEVAGASTTTTTTQTVEVKTVPTILPTEFTISAASIK